MLKYIDVRIEGMVPRHRLAGAGGKPLQAVWVKSPSRERFGKGVRRR